MFSWTFAGNMWIRLCLNEVTLSLYKDSMLNVLLVNAIAGRLFYFAWLCSLTYGLVSFNNILSGDADGFRVIDHFVDISYDDCRKECGRHVSCAHAAYERRYRLCTLLEGSNTPPTLAPGFAVASKANGDIVVRKCCQQKLVHRYRLFNSQPKCNSLFAFLFSRHETSCVV